MGYMGYNEIITIVLSSFGGAAVALGGLAKFLAGTIAKRIEQKEKLFLDKQLEDYRNQLEITKAVVSRIGESQFSLYNTLWKSLFTLQKAGDDLWDIASHANLSKFTLALKNTKSMVDENLLLIEDRHIFQLTNLLTALGKYESGKKDLIELRDHDNVSEDAIRSAIDSNNNYRQEYNELLREIANSFKNQIRGQNY